MKRIPSVGLSNLQRIIRAVDTTDVNTCWNTVLTPNGAGYGIVRAEDGRQRPMHQLAYEVFIGPRNNLHCLHSCDNRKCCNPYHLFLGTHQDNMRDSVNKNRRHKPKGMLHPRAKLSDDDVIKMRALLKTGRRQKDISIMFGISRQTVTHINRRITWPHIP